MNGCKFHREVLRWRNEVVWSCPGHCLNLTRRCRESHSFVGHSNRVVVFRVNRNLERVHLYHVTRVLQRKDFDYCGSSVRFVAKASVQDGQLSHFRIKCEIRWKHAKAEHSPDLDCAELLANQQLIGHPYFDLASLLEWYRKIYLQLKCRLIRYQGVIDDKGWVFTL